MKTKFTLIGIIVLFSFTNYKLFEKNTNTEVGTASLIEIPANKIPIEWLSGEQPKLLSLIANAGSVRESLNGTSISASTVIGGWHAQAVGQYQDYIYVGFSNGKLSSDKVPAAEKNPDDYAAKLWIYNVKTAESKIVELEKGYPHPCSIQITGNYLTIAIEAEYGISQAALGAKRAERSMAVIFDLKQDPNCSKEVGRVVQAGMNSGGAGLAYQPIQKCWYMLLDQDFANGRVAVYKTTSAELNTWQKEPIAYYPRFGSGAGLNLVTATDNSIWGLWYDTSLENMPEFSKFEMAADQIKMFKLIGADGAPVLKRDEFTQNINIGSPKLKGAGELLADRPGMRFGAGIRFENGKIEILTCQRNMNTAFNIDRFKIEDGARTQVMYVNLSKARGEIKCSSTSNATQKYSQQNMLTESWNMVLQSPITAEINYMPLKVSFGSLPKFTSALKINSSAPLVLIYLEGDSEVKGFSKEFFTTKKTDEQKAK